MAARTLTTTQRRATREVMKLKHLTNNKERVCSVSKPRSNRICFEEMLQETDEIAVKRKHTQETLHILQQVYRTLYELPLEAESVYNHGTESNHQELLTSSKYSTSSSYSASPSSRRRSRRAGDRHQNGYGF